MSFVAVGVSVGSKVIGGVIKGNANKRAAQTQANAADRANQMQWDMFQEQQGIYQKNYDQQRLDEQPWRQAGLGALEDMRGGDFQRDFTAEDFKQDPGYEFRMKEGQKALERSASARGGIQGGRAMKELARYGQGFASNEYSNAYNRFNSDRDRRFKRLSNIAGIGQNSAVRLASAGSNYTGSMGGAASRYATAYGENTMGAGNAKAGAQVANGNLWGGVASGIGQGFMNASMMGRRTPGGQAGGSYGNYGGIV